MLRAETNGNFGEQQHLVTSANAAVARTRRIGNHFWLLILTMAACFTVAAHGQQYYYVDCTGVATWEYPSITSALGVAGPGSVILVTGPCNENVSIDLAQNLNIGAWYGQTATINGNVNVYASNDVFLYGLNVTNPAGNAFEITSSHAVVLDSCTGNGNSGYGVYAQSLSEVTVTGPSSFDNNGSGGIDLNSNTVLGINSWAGATDISSNKGPGVWLSSGSLFASLGSTTILNNANAAGVTPSTAFGITELGGSKVQIGTCFGNNVIQGNQAGGVEIEENSELSFWSCGQPYQSLILSNGPVGISAGLGVR